jgi:phenylacetaldehyde dehydrogenase
MDVAIAGTSSAIFFNMGQCCTAGSRLYAHRRVFDRLMQGVADRAGRIRVGHGLDPETQLGPLVSDEQFRRVTGYLAAGREQGARVVTGGDRVGDAGYFVQPTVLTETKPEMSVVREEIFGPVVCAMPFDDDDLDRLARTANDTPYGLAASIWTRDLGIAHKLARRIKAGTVWINTTILATRRCLSAASNNPAGAAKWASRRSSSTPRSRRSQPPSDRHCNRSGAATWQRPRRSKPSATRSPRVPNSNAC